MDFFFRAQDNPYGDDDDEGGESHEETDDANGSYDQDGGENQSLPTGHGFGYYNRDPSDDDDGYKEESESGEKVVGSGQYASDLDKMEQLALSFDSQDAEDDAEYGDDSYGADEDDAPDSSISKLASYQPQIPSFNNLMTAKKSATNSNISKYELGYEDEEIVPLYGVFAIVAVIVWYLLRRCCSRGGNNRKKLRSNAKISYNVSPKFRPEMTIV